MKTYIVSIESPETRDTSVVVVAAPSPNVAHRLAQRTARDKKGWVGVRIIGSLVVPAEPASAEAFVRDVAAEALVRDVIRQHADVKSKALLRTTAAAVREQEDDDTPLAAAITNLLAALDGEPQGGDMPGG